MGENTERNKRRRERQQANLEWLEAETQAENARMLPFDDAVVLAKSELDSHAYGIDSHAIDAIERLIDAKIRRAAFKLGLDPDKLW